MRFTIIGSNGFLANAIGEYCNRKNFELTVYGLDKPTGHDFDVFHKVNLLNEELNYNELSVSDIIIYAVGAGIQSNLNESVDLIYTLNVTIPVRICNRLKQVNYNGTFVSFGSVFEMGMTSENRFLTETDIINSTFMAPNDYAISKRMFTRYVNSYQHDFKHWHFILPTIYGEKENPQRLIPYTINAIKQNKPISFTSGDQTRQYINVNEIPMVIEKCILLQLQSGIYNTAGNQTVTVKDIVTLIHSYFDKEIPENCFGTAKRSDTGMKYLALDATKLYTAIDYTPVLTINQTLDKY